MTHSSCEDHSLSHNSHTIEIANSTCFVNPDKLFDDVKAMEDELKDIETIYAQLSSSHEESKTLHNARIVKDLWAKMDNDVTKALEKAKLIKSRFIKPDIWIAIANIPECSPGSSSKRTRTSDVNGRKKLQESMNQFQELRQKMASEYRETVQRRYYTVTGENPDKYLLDILISAGQSETFLQKAIQEQGRGQVMDTIMEIQERHDAVKDLDRNLKELHQTFLDLAVSMHNLGGVTYWSGPLIIPGAQRLMAEKMRQQRRTRKRTCYGIILLLVIILITVFSVQPWKR